MAWSAKNDSGGRVMSRPDMRTLCINSRNGKSCRTSQIRFGKQLEIEEMTPSQNQRLPKKRRAGVAISPATTPTMKKAIEYLFSRPTPASAPKRNQKRGFAVLMALITHQDTD